MMSDGRRDAYGGKGFGGGLIVSRDGEPVGEMSGDEHAPPPVAEAVCDASDFANSDAPVIYGVPGEPGFRREPPASPDCPPYTGAEVYWRWHDAKAEFEAAAMVSKDLNELTRVHRRVAAAHCKVTEMVRSVEPALVDVGFGHVVQFVGGPAGFAVHKLVPGGLVEWPPEEGK